MKLAGIALLLIGSSAFAANTVYDLNLDLSLNGQHISSPHVSVEEGSTATVTQKTNIGQNFIDVVAHESTVANHPGVIINFTIGTIDKNGTRTILSQPQVVVKENSPALLKMEKTAKNSNAMSLSVTAKRKII